MRVIYHGNSDVGLKRRLNEDNWGVSEELNLFIVADGMGGHQAGEVASDMVVQRFPQLLAKTNLNDPDAIPLAIEEAINKVHKEVSVAARKDGEKKGMGTTLASLLLRHNRFWSANIGDSPIMLFRDGEMIKVTKDQTFVQEQLDRGMITAQEAKFHRYRHILTQSIGGKKKLRIPIISGKIKRGDVFLICSDGLSNALEADDIAIILRSNDSLPKKVDTLIDKAKEFDGSDNITVLLVYIEELDQEASLIKEDTIKFDNIFSADMEEEEEEDGPDSPAVEPADEHDFEPAETMLFDSEGLHGNDRVDQIDHRLKKIILAFAGGILIIALIVMSIHFIRMERKTTTDILVAGNTLEEQENPGSVTDEEPTIEIDVDSDGPLARDSDPDLQPLPVERDQQAKETMDPDAAVEPEQPPATDLQPADQPPVHAALKPLDQKAFAELESFTRSTIKEKSQNKLDHLVRRYAALLKAYPNMYTIKVGSYSKPAESIFGPDFAREIAGKDFFILRKNQDNTNWYMLFVGLFSDQASAQAFLRKSSLLRGKKIWRMGDIFNDNIFE